MTRFTALRQPSIFAIAMRLMVLAACGHDSREKHPRERFTREVILKTTPVKDQGNSRLCWIYAMLATIETEHLMMGDSVNLSPAYVARAFFNEQTQRQYVIQGRQEADERGMISMVPQLLLRNGAMPFDSYRLKDDFNSKVVIRRLTKLAMASQAHNKGLSYLQSETNTLLDEAVGPLPRMVFMYGCEYTPLEFAHSVCQTGEYVGLTSFTHHAFGKPFVLEVPDNLYSDPYHNLPMSALIDIMESAIRTGHPVCWEGDVTEPGFSFERGTATLEDKQGPFTQENRQQAFEQFKTTDDHCMAMVGIAIDRKGRKYFVCKDSSGTHHPYGGMIYMSFDYAFMKTVAVMMSRKAFNLPDISAGKSGQQPLQPA